MKKITFDLNLRPPPVKTIRLKSSDVMLVESDSHLGQLAANPEILQGVISNLKPNYFVINGDLVHEREYLFDNFINLNRSEKHFVDTLNVNSLDSNVIWIPGDHDIYNPDIDVRPTTIADEINIHNAVKVEIGNGKSVLILHGHQFKSDYEKSKILKKIFIPIYYTMQFAASKAETADRLLRSIKNHKIYRREFNFIARQAAQAALQHNCDYVIIGHTHRPGIRRFKVRKTTQLITVISPGGTIDRNFFTIITPNKGVDLISLRKKNI